MTNDINSKKPQMLRLSQVSDSRGNLTFLQYPVNLPFEVKRLFYLYDIPDGAHRGGHAHRVEQQILIALAGSFKVRVFDGKEWEEYYLDNPAEGLYLPPAYWRDLVDFAPGSVCLTISSTPFDADEYLSPMEEYLDYLAGRKA